MQVAALDVFEALIFNYKTKIGLPDSLSIAVLTVISEFSEELNVLLKENGSQNSTETGTAEDSENLKCSDSVLKSEGSCQDIPLVFSFCNHEIENKPLELVEIPVTSDIETQEPPVTCDVSDTERADLICENPGIDSIKVSEDSVEYNTSTKPIKEEEVEEDEKVCFNLKQINEDNFLRSTANENQEKKVCDACCRKFPSSSKLQVHLAKCLKIKNKVRSDGEEYKCNVCEVTFSSQRLLNSHRQQSHGNETDQQPADDSMLYSVVEVQSLPENLPFYCCKTCLFVYKTPVDFEAHSCKEVSDNTESEGYVGDYFHLLGKYLVSNPDLLARMRKFRCGTCCEEYRSLSRMLYHLLRCTQGPYPCELCGLECASKRELNGHKRKAHRDVNSFFCDECGLAFKLRTSLQKHKVNRHERRADTTCEQCNLTFSKRIQLTNHMIREHQAERKFLCQVCGKKFSTHGSLMAHLTSHSEPFKFSCSYCNKKFRQKEKLKFHIRIHTGERPHLCPTCGKGFIRKSKLDDHMRRHRGEKQYHCSTCSKSYASSWDLKLHIRKQHPDYSVPTNSHSATSSEMMEPIASEVDVDEPAEGTTAVATTVNLIAGGETAETLKPECTQFPDLPEDAALAQLAELPLTATEPSVVEALAPTEGKLVMQLEPSQVPATLMQATGDAVGTRLLLQLGQNNDPSSRILVQLDGGQVAAASGQATLLQPSTILTVADALQLTPVVDDLNLNLGTVPAQYLQLTAATAGTNGSADSTHNTHTGPATTMPVHIQLPVSTVPVPATALSQPATGGTNPFGLQPVPVQAVFTPTGFNVNSISY
ncbi:Protein suppressor of hairy wing [Gryllus bimaculatus]|nr:Protein suppressor of hairy wing [Gryllus bimaculatus]